MLGMNRRLAVVAELQMLVVVVMIAMVGLVWDMWICLALVDAVVVLRLVD